MMNRTAFHRNAPKYYVAVIIGQDLQDGQDFFQNTSPSTGGRSPFAEEKNICAPYLSKSAQVIFRRLLSYFPTVSHVHKYAILFIVFGYFLKINSFRFAFKCSFVYFCGAFSSKIFFLDGFL